MTTKQFSVLSLFTGVGGLDYGFEAAGFETRVALERDRQCCESLRASRDWPVIEDDLLETATKDILKMGGLGARSVDMLIGSPPCQPFSKSGWWKSGDSLRLEDPRAGTLSFVWRRNSVQEPILDDSSHPVIDPHTHRQKKKYFPTTHTIQVSLEKSRS